MRSTAFLFKVLETAITIKPIRNVAFVTVLLPKFARFIGLPAKRTTVQTVRNENNTTMFRERDAILQEYGKNAKNPLQARKATVWREALPHRVIGIAANWCHPASTSSLNGRNAAASPHEVFPRQATWQFGAQPWRSWDVPTGSSRLARQEEEKFYVHLSHDTVTHNSHK
jgi:hypothetical protein